MNPDEPIPPRRHMPAGVELALRAVGLAAIVGAVFVDEGPGRWLAVGGGLWLAGIYLYRALTERPNRRHLFWAVVFVALSAWLWTRA
ncbi:hypothetical protein [Phenylobacterium sp.]|uniref:hypothetical protein n=1 Tax=Phenylobacterium sp. TaxID=1871053 RepID=UPI002FC9FD92